MRTYSVALAALAVDAPDKWLDNLLSQHDAFKIVSLGQRGKARRIAYPVLVKIAVVRELCESLGVSVAVAVQIAEELLSAKGASVRRGGQLTIALDRPALETALATRLGSALESAPSPRRGRPPRRDAPG